MCLEVRVDMTEKLIEKYGPDGVIPAWKNVSKGKDGELYGPYQHSFKYSRGRNVVAKSGRRKPWLSSKQHLGDYDEINGGCFHFFLNRADARQSRGFPRPILVRVKDLVAAGVIRLSLFGGYKMTVAAVAFEWDKTRRA